MEISEFIHLSNRARGIDTLVGLFCDALSPYGYHGYVWFSPGGPQPDITYPVGGVLHYDPNMLTEYRRCAFVLDDPIYRLMWREYLPFTWDDILELPLTDAQLTPMQRRRDLGYVKGLCIPIHDHEHGTIGINLASRNPSARADREAMAHLFAFSHQFYIRRNELLHGGDPLGGVLGYAGHA